MLGSKIDRRYCCLAFVTVNSRMAIIYKFRYNVVFKMFQKWRTQAILGPHQRKWGPPSGPHPRLRRLWP